VRIFKCAAAATDRFVVATSFDGQGGVSVQRARGLPQLNGSLGTAVRLVYVALAILTAIIVGGSVIFNGLDFFRNSPAEATWGLRTFSSVNIGAPPYIGWVSPEAEKRGLRVNDVIIAIQGTKLRRDATEFDIGQRLAAIRGDSALITTRRTDGSVVAHTMPRAPHPWLTPDFRSTLPLWLSAIATFLGIEVIPLFLLGASLLLFSRRSTDPEAMLFAIGFLLLCNIPVSDFWLLALWQVPVNVSSDMLAAGQCIVIIAAAGFPDGNFESRWSRIVLIAAIPVTIATRIAHGVAANAQASGAISATALLLLGGVAMIGLEQRYRLIEDIRARQQIKWVVLGFSVSAIASAAYMGLLNSNVNLDGAVPQFIAFQLLQLLAFVALPLGLVVSLLRYRLYDAEATISLTVAYSLLTISLLAVFAGSEKVIEIMGEQYFGEQLGVLAGGLGAAIAAVMMVPMHHRVMQWAEHRFRSGLVQLRIGLPQLVGDLRATASPRVLTDAMLARVEKGVRAHHGAVMMNDEVVETRDVDARSVETWWTANKSMMDAETDLLCDRADPLFPVRVPLRGDGVGLVGWLLLGPRPDGSFYGNEERAALRDLADPIARALAIAVEREHREADRRDRENTLTSRVDSITERLNTLSAIVLERLGSNSGVPPDGASTG
jgi:hypothetical protein